MNAGIEERAKFVSDTMRRVLNHRLYLAPYNAGLVLFLINCLICYDNMIPNII